MRYENIYSSFPCPASGHFSAASAHAAPLNNATLDDICAEWAREFWFEGRRRMDLIRFNKFAGQSDYKWEFMGGEAKGTSFPSFRKVFAIPQADLSNNPNLKQNNGYN